LPISVFGLPKRHSGFILLKPEADLMQESKPQPSQANDRFERRESAKATAQSATKFTISSMSIIDDSWRESQVEEPERWDGMS
jgi:hypothetical protein